MPSLLASVAVVAMSAVTAIAGRAQQPTRTPDFVGAVNKILPSLVTVRTWVRADATKGEANGEAKVATATAPEQTGWLVEPPSERDYPGFRPFGQASGFFVSAEGDVLTTLSALRVSDDKNVDIVEIEATAGQRILAEIVGIEPTLQLAVLRCAVFTSWAKPAMRPVEFADSDAAAIGSWVLAAADPAGPERFLGTGLLSAKPSRDCYQELMSATYMQATIAVPSGAFGGPLVDLDGKVLGILTTLDGGGSGRPGPMGSAWALPSKIVTGLYDAIRTAGTSKSPWLGFSVMSRAEIVAARGFQAFQTMQKPAHGILLENVYAPSPASKAELKPGDFLTHFAGVEIHAPVDFQRQLYLAGVGREVEVVMFRDGETFRRTITIEARPPEAKPR